MTESEFSKLKLPQRAEHVFLDGDYVETITYYGFNIHLYILDGKYIEVFYNRLSNEIEDIEILDPEERRLGLYTKSVSIEELFS